MDVLRVKSCQPDELIKSDAFPQWDMVSDPICICVPDSVPAGNFLFYAATEGRVAHPLQYVSSVSFGFGQGG